MTPTGIEPVLPPWKGDVLTAWPWSQRNSPSRTRTYDSAVNSRVLYRLSYWGILIFKGYNSLNIRDLVKECDIAIGTFYNYYKNKDEIVNAIIKADWEKIIASTAAKMKNQDLNFKEKMYIMYDGVNEFFKNYLDTFMVMISNGAREHRYRNDKILVPYENILKEWRKHSYTIGKIVEVHEPFSKPYDGYVLGISRDGSLVVEKIDGTLEKVISGECVIKN